MKKKQRPGIDMVLHGWMAKDPEFTTTPGGKAVAGFSIAYRYPIKKTGEELTKWFNCKAFDALAEYIAENYRARDFISCKVHYLSLWKDKNGSTREEYIISNVITADESEPDFSTEGGEFDGPPI